jgi:tetratricopeptide (TPR) repeat protein
VANSGVGLPEGSALIDVGMAPLRTLGPPERLHQVVHPDLRWEFPPLRLVTAHSLPGPLTVRPAIGVVGRKTELAMIADAVKRVSEGEGREVIVVSGEAGLGKTTLLAESARAAFDEGACVLFGHCEEDLATPYRLFAEALGHYVHHAPDEQLVAHVNAYGSELARLVPALAIRVPDLPPCKATDADAERYLLFAAVAGLMATISAHQPIILVFDDLQWADPGSLQLLSHLTGSDQASRLLVLGAFRDTELSNAHPLFGALAGLHRHRRATRVELSGLDDAEVLELVETRAGHQLDDAGAGLAQALYRETDGNPFFVGEVLRHLVETSAIYRDAAGRWVTAGGIEDIGLPTSVREVIGARVGRLGTSARWVLALAAVVGRDFDLEVLARAADISEDDVLDALDAASAAALIREHPGEPGRYNFAHALIQHTLYEDLGPTRRARYHRQVAEALEDLVGDHPGERIGELARHWFNAALPKDPTKALAYSRQAANAALDALAPGDALRYYTQAFDLYAQLVEPDLPVGIDLGIGLGIAQRQTGDPGFRETLLYTARRAAELEDTERLTTATLANDRGLFSTTGFVDVDRVELLRTALARLPADHPDRALVLATLCKELVFGSPLEGRQALADEAIATAQSIGDDAIIVRVLNHVSQGLQAPPLVRPALLWTADALARAKRVGDPHLLFFAAIRRAEFTASAGDIGEMDRCLAIMETLAEQVQLPRLDWLNTLGQATRAVIAGDTDRAEQLATDALQIGTDGGEPDAISIFGAQLLTVNFQRGTMGDFVPLVEQMAAETPGAAPSAIAVLAAAHAESDRTDEARRRLEELATRGFELPLDLLWTTGMTMYAEGAIECRDPHYAQPIFDRLAPWADQLSSTPASAEGPVSHYLGGLATVLGRFDQADAYYARAAAMNERMTARFFAARTDLSWGRLLMERRAPGDVPKARALLQKAHSVASAHGYGTVERRAAAALHDSG